MASSAGSIQGEYLRPSLSVSLKILPHHIELCRMIPVTALKLSARPSNCLERAEIHSLGELLALSEGEMLRFPSMGKGSIEEIKKKLRSFLHKRLGDVSPPPVEIPQSEIAPVISLPRTLADEWKMFAAGRACPPDKPLHDLKLDEKTRERIRDTGATSINELLGWNWQEAEKRLGDDPAEKVSNALIECAQEYRGVAPEAPAHPGANALEQMLETRWSEVRLEHLGFHEETVQLLRGDSGDLSGARCTNFAEVLAALEKAGSLLHWNLAACRDVETRLRELGLKERVFSWRGILLASSPREYSLAIFLQKCREVCREREWKILCDRCGLNEELTPRTLQEVGDGLNVTRERVRQIEVQGHKKLRRAEGVVGALAQSLRFVAEETGGVLTAEEAGRRLSRFFVPDGVAAEGVCLLLFQAFDDFKMVARVGALAPRNAAAPTRGPIYALTDKVENFAPVIEKARALWAKRKTAIRSEEWVHQVVEALRDDGHEMETDFVAACLRADGRFDPERFEQAEAVLRLEEALVETLQYLGEPAHFTKIAAALNELKIWKRQANVASLHMRLNLHQELFVCLGRGIYGLVAWGLEEKRVTRDRSISIAALLEEFLEKRGKPCRIRQMTEYAKSRKRCKTGSVQSCLGKNARFHRVALGVYGLKKWLA